MTNIKELLETEICSELDNLGDDIELGSETYKVTVEGITKLIEKRIDLEKLEQDARVKERDYELDKTYKERTYELESKKVNGDLDDRTKSREIESKKLEQITNDKNDQLFKNVIAIANIVIPSVLTVWGTFKTLKFEETGTVTTIMGRGFINKLIPKK